MKDAISLFKELAIQLLEEEQKNPVSKYILPDELFNELDLSLPESPIDSNKYKQSLKELILRTPRTATNAFFNQLFGGRNEKAVLGDLLSVLLNNSMYTYKVAGPMVGVEKVILRKVCDLVGWDKNSDGTFATGGSMANFMALLMGRDTLYKEAQRKGVQQNMTIYTSVESHYSIPKNASFSGIGRDNVRYIATDDRARMLPDELESAIRKDIDSNYQPIWVNLTAGTTVLGAFDPINKISQICKKYGIWLHVDGAYCGSVLFSKKYKYLIEGIREVDSFSLNAHKMLGTPLTCSILVVKNKENLYHSFANDASYLYQTAYDDLNLGKTSLQCGRRNDALKLWTLWKSIGTKGIEKMIEKQFDLADFARDYIRTHPDYTLYSFDDSISVCFNYKGIPARDICTGLYKNSILMVGFGTFLGNEFIRLVTVNANNSSEDILRFFKTIEDFVNTKRDNKF